MQGELQFVLAPANGIGPVVALPGADPGFGRGGQELTVSPDGAHLAWTDHEARVWLRPLMVRESRVQQSRETERYRYRDEEMQKYRERD